MTQNLKLIIELNQGMDDTAFFPILPEPCKRSCLMLIRNYDNAAASTAEISSAINNPLVVSFKCFSLSSIRPCWQN